MGVILCSIIATVVVYYVLSIFVARWKNTWERGPPFQVSNRFRRNLFNRKNYASFRKSDGGHSGGSGGRQAEMLEDNGEYYTLLPII